MNRLVFTFLFIISGLLTILFSGVILLISINLGGSFSFSLIWPIYLAILFGVFLFISGLLLIKSSKINFILSFIILFLNFIIQIICCYKLIPLLIRENEWLTILFILFIEPPILPVIIISLIGIIFLTKRIITKNYS